jgi:hydrogenase expression/formation protein HypC
MCVGTPFQLDADGAFEAPCTGRHERRTLSLLLTGPLPAGAWVLAQGNLAIRAIDAHEALLVAEALDACAAAEVGGDFEAGFADLINRTPTLPDWLKPAGPGADADNPTGLEETAHG